MSQYTTNTGVGAQAHKPSTVENLKLKAEGLVDKITGHSHAGTTTGTTGTTGQQGYGGGQAHTGTTGQQGYGGGQPHTGTTGQQGYGGEQPYAGTTGQQGYGGQQGNTGRNPEYAHQTPTGHHTGTAGTAGTTGEYGNQKPSMLDKVKNAISPGHQSDTVGAHQGTGTGTGYDSSAAPGATGLSTTDKIKNMLPGHHKTTGTGTGYGNQNTY